MDIVIYTDNPDHILDNLNAIRRAIEELGFDVGVIYVEDN